MHYLQEFFVGALLCNCIPHLAAGLQGRRFPTPFAKPRGVGQSSSLLNFIWGAANLFLGLFLLWRFHPVIETLRDALPFTMGFMALGTYLARHFGKVFRNVDAGRKAVSLGRED